MHRSKIGRGPRCSHASVWFKAELANPFCDLSISCIFFYVC